MGKKKQPQRTKNNVVPASSGRSAELLQSTSGMPFVGFSTLKEGGFIPILSGISDELDLHINEDFRLVWKKMNKKDTTTKLKALDEFKKLCASCDVEALRPVLPYWPRLFCALAADEEHRVREAAHSAHRALVAKAGRNIAPHLKQLVGPWFTGQHDTYPPAASTAQAAFQEAFPPNKLVEAIVFCQEEILNYICNNLLNQTAQTLTNSQTCSQEERDAKYQRVVVSCLNGYALYLQRLPTEHLHKAEEANRKLVSSAKFWRFNKDPAAIVRAAFFTAVVSLCDKAAFLLTPEAKPLCMAVFNNMDDTDPAVVHSIWQAVLFTFTVVEDVWKYVSLEKLVLPKLWKVLRNGADGNASLVYPHILPLLSKIPSSLFQDPTSFYSELFKSFRTGLKVRSVQISAQETSAVITAFLECLRYLTNINPDNEKLTLSLFEEQVFPLLEVVMTDSKLQLARPSLFSGLASLLSHWHRRASSPLLTSVWTRLANLCKSLLDVEITDSCTLATNCVAVEVLLSALRHPDSQPRKNFKVKFVSPQKSSDEEADEPSPSLTEQAPLVSSYEEACSNLIQGQLKLIFQLKSFYKASSEALATLVARVVAEYDSEGLFAHLVSLDGDNWARFYRRVLAVWLRDDNIPLDVTLRLVFTLLRHVTNDTDVQSVYADLSGGGLSVDGGKETASLQSLKEERWQKVIEWALRSENQTPCVKQWLISNNGRGVCNLVSVLTRSHSCYNSLHTCLRNLRHNGWLTPECLVELVRTLRHNLLSPSVPEDVKLSSADFLQAMLHNAANHSPLTQLPAAELQGLLYELLKAALQGRDHFPNSWQQCLAVLALQSGADLTFSAVCETCVDLVLSAVKTREMDLTTSQQLLAVLQDLVIAGGQPETQLTVVLSRLCAGVRPLSQLVWGLYITAETVTGSLTHSHSSQQLKSPDLRDPLASVPLQQYVTSMIPFLMVVVKLQTSAHPEEDSDQFPFAQLRAAVAPEDLWAWTLEILQLHSLCTMVKTHFVNTKQYFLLKEKITFVLEECGLLSQLRVKDLIKHLDLSLLDEKSSSLLDCGPLARLQKEVVIKDLGLLYDVQQIQKNFIPLKSRNAIIKNNYFPEEALEEIAAGKSVERAQLAVVNTCCRRLATLGGSDNIHISILDRVFDQYVAAEKENRSLLHVPDKELLHIAAVAEFAAHSVARDSAHMKESSWDACLVATAALCHSVSSTLNESPQWGKRIQSKASPPPPENTTLPAAQEQSMLSEEVTSVEDREDFLQLPLIRVMVSVSHLFDTVSAHMLSVDPEDKAAATRRTEWTDVFLPGTHGSVVQAWLIVAESPCDSPARSLLIETLSLSVARYVQYPHFVTDNDTLSCLDVCCRLLQSLQSSVQLAAYHLLIKLIPAMVELDMKECEKDTVALSCQHVDQTLVYTQGIIEVILSGLSFGDLCTVEPFTDSYTFTYCYLLLWSALLDLCATATPQLRALYTTWLKEEYLAMFMRTVFCLMPEYALHGEVHSQRIAQLFTKSPQLDKGVWGSERLAHLSCWVFACALRRLPAAVRQWWTETEHRVSCIVEHVTATYISPDLCADEMKAIQAHEKNFENMTVHVLPGAKEVYAIYTVEECHMELVIELAPNHPLGLVKVRGGQRMVSTLQTRQRLLQITIFLTHQNGSIWDALELWKTSLDKRFEGVEECYICFAILHSSSHQLPKLSCQTCRKKFHSHCLYKWFTTSNKSTCPICRNLF